MFFLTPPSAETSAPVRRLEAHIDASSPFTPALWICPSCSHRNALSSTACDNPRCARTFSSSYPLLDQRSHPVALYPFPVHWLCSTCYESHLVMEILIGDVSCGCGRPELQAVYDQFGDLFLFWPDDEGVRDLRERRKVEEAKRRLWVAGGEEWVGEMPRIRMEETGAGKGEGMGLGMEGVEVGMEMMSNVIPMVDVAA